MGKKKPKEPKETLYVDIRAKTKRRIQRLADLNERKLNAQVDLALQDYCDREEGRLGLADVDTESS